MLLQTKMAKTCLLLFSRTFLNKPNNYIHSRDSGKSKNLGGQHYQNKRKIIKHLMNLPFGKNGPNGRRVTFPPDLVVVKYILISECSFPLLVFVWQGQGKVLSKLDFCGVY